MFDGSAGGVSRWRAVVKAICLEINFVGDDFLLQIPCDDKFLTSMTRILTYLYGEMRGYLHRSRPETANGVSFVSKAVMFDTLTTLAILTTFMYMHITRMCTLLEKRMHALL